MAFSFSLCVSPQCAYLSFSLVYTTHSCFFFMDVPTMSICIYLICSHKTAICCFLCMPPQCAYVSLSLVLTTHLYFFLDAYPDICSSLTCSHKTQQFLGFYACPCSVHMYLSPTSQHIYKLSLCMSSHCVNIYVLLVTIKHSNSSLLMLIPTVNIYTSLTTHLYFFL